MRELGFPNDELYRFRIENRRFRVNSAGAETLGILIEIYNASVSSNTIGWALAFRGPIRRIELLKARSVLTYVIQQTPDDRMRLLAIWLRGRCGGYIGTAIVAKCADSPSFTMQKESVRALTRMSGWPELRGIADTTTNPRIRIMATQRAARSLDDRLSSVLTQLRPVPIKHQRREIWTLPGLQLKLTPPKTLEYIRRILLRIKRLASRP